MLRWISLLVIVVEVLIWLFASLIRLLLVTLIALGRRMFAHSLQLFRQQAAEMKPPKMKKEDYVQPCVVKFVYTGRDEKNEEREFTGYNFVRDMEDALVRARAAAEQNSGELLFVWVAHFTEDDPKLDLLIGTVLKDNVSIPIDEDRVVRTMYSNYKTRVKDPKAARKQQAANNASKHFLRGKAKLTPPESKPRIRLKSDSCEIVSAPAVPAYRPFSIATADSFQKEQDVTPDIPTANFPAVQSASRAEIPWEDTSNYD